MITPGQMYWLTRLDTIHELASGTLIFLLVCLGLLSVVTVIGTIVTMSDGDENVPQVIKVLYRSWKGAAFAVAFFMTIYAFTPTTKEMAAIIVIPQIANSTVVTEKIPAELSELYTLAKQYVVRQLKEEEKKEGERGK